MISTFSGLAASATKVPRPKETLVVETNKQTQRSTQKEDPRVAALVQKLPDLPSDLPELPEVGFKKKTRSKRKVALESNP